MTVAQGGSRLVKRAIGLMSGTSLDGIDAALIETDGVTAVRRGAALTLPFDTALRSGLKACLGGGGDVPATAHRLTLLAGEAVGRLLGRAGMKPDDIDVIGFHGQTIVHRPAEGLTWQIGNGALLAEATGIDVVCDFRSRDMASGGEGAPLAPLYHAALAAALDRSPVCILNVGGVANVTWIGDGKLIAFDTGPGGALLDDWTLARTGEPFDRDGGLAARGKPCHDRVTAVFHNNPWFDRPPPRSLDRDAIAIDLAGLSTADGAATLVDLTAEAVEHARRFMPRDPMMWIVCGGGRRNRHLVAALQHRLAPQVRVAEDVGWDGDSLEAEAFAYLAVRSLAGLPLSQPSTTGCREPVTGGAYHRVRQA